MRHSAKHCIARLSALARCTAVPELNTLAKFTQTCGPLSLVQTNHLFDLGTKEITFLTWRFLKLHVSLQSLL